MEPASPPGLGELTATFLRIGVLGFGGPAGQIALMHRVLVDEKRWISEEHYLAALNFCMLLPGPEAQQLATYAGWRLRGWQGGVIAGTLFVIPGLVLVIALSAFYAAFHRTGGLDGVFLGLKAAVLVIVVEALVRVSRRALGGPLAAGIAVAAFLALFVFSAPFWLVLLVAALIGYVALRSPAVPAPVADPVRRRSGAAAAMRVVAIWGSLWLAPLLLIVPLGAWDGVFGAIFRFFSVVSVVTFGGAYAVLAYVAQEAVGSFGWLQPGEMLDGLALAETTPGPLVLVLSFVGFLAAYRDASGIDPLLAGVLGGTLVAWVTFIPCFLFVFLGAPHIEQVSRNPALGGGLAAVTAAVVGVIANLALWFAIHALFRTVTTVRLGTLEMSLPDLASLDWLALRLTGLGGLLLFAIRAGLVPTLGICAVAGFVAERLL